MVEQDRGSVASWWRASRTGNGVGLTALVSADGSSQLVINVLPKIWRPAGAKTAHVAPGAGRHTITVYEGDVLGFPEPWAAAVATGVRRAVIPQILSDVDDRIDVDHPGPEPTGELDPLWSPTTTPRTKAVAAMRGPASAHAAGLQALLSALKVPPANVPGTIVPSMSGAAAVIDDDFGELLARTRFLDAASAVIPNLVTSTYISESAIGSSPSGSLHVERTARLAAQGSGAASFTRQQLTTNSSMWRLVKVAAISCAPVGSLTKQANAVVAGLPDVSAVDKREWDVLIRDVRHMLVPPVLRPLVAAAVAVVEQRWGRAFDLDAGAALLVNVKYATSTLWEKMLGRAFELADCNVNPGAKLPVLFERTPNGWEDLHAKKPDLVAIPTAASDDAGSFIVDAKYMQRAGFRGASKSDQYQMITYAMAMGRTAILGFVGAPDAHTKDSASGSVLTSEFRIPPFPMADIEGSHAPTPDTTGWIKVGSIDFPFPTGDELAEASDADAALANLAAMAHRLLAEVGV